MDRHLSGELCRCEYELLVKNTEVLKATMFAFAEWILKGRGNREPFRFVTLENLSELGLTVPTAGISQDGQVVDDLGAKAGQSSTVSGEVQDDVDMGDSSEEVEGDSGDGATSHMLIHASGTLTHCFPRRRG